MDSELNSKLVKITNESLERIKKQKVEDNKTSKNRRYEET